MTLKGISEVIRSSNSFVLLPHVSADGDSIGSATGLSLALKKLGKNVTVILEEEIPNVFKFLKGIENIIVCEEGCNITCDCIIALDTGDTKRLGKRLNIFEACSNTINIDHHQTNTGFAKENYVDATASAVAEIMWDLIEELNIEIDSDIAACLYTGIMTDTGGFRYSNTTAKTHNIAGKIIDMGVQTDKIASNVFENSTVSRLKLIGYVLNTLEMHFDKRAAILTLTTDMLEKADASDEDAEGLVNYAKGIMGTEVGIMLRETKDGIRVNFRSKSYVDVAEITSAFGGGGHKRAAGCTVQMTIDEAKEQILEALKKVFEG